MEEIIKNILQIDKEAIENEKEQSRYLRKRKTKLKKLRMT